MEISVKVASKMVLESVFAANHVIRTLVVYYFFYQAKSKPCQENSVGTSPHSEHNLLALSASRDTE
jgi:hypothetical protein